MVKSICCCAVQNHITEQGLREYLYHADSTSLENLKDIVTGVPDSYDIVTIRQAFQSSVIPFRPKACPRHIRICCGICTRSCKTRCVQDILHRSFLYLHEFRGTDISEWPAPIRSLYNTLHPKQGLPGYELAVRGILEIIALQRNSDLAGRMLLYGFDSKVRQYANHPHKFDYSARLTTDIDPETGFFRVLDWPQSGMCPFCISSKVGQKARRRNPERRGAHLRNGKRR